MPVFYSGKCLCGAISVSIKSEPAAVLSCFCDHCSKGAGGPNQVIAKFSHDDVDVTKATQDNIAVRTFTDTASGSPKEKSFCKDCGVTLWTVPASAKGKFLLVRTAILDNGLELRPQNEIFVKNRPAWMGALQGAGQWEEARS